MIVDFVLVTALVVAGSDRIISECYLMQNAQAKNPNQHVMS